MDDFWALLAALATFVLPMALAWWLLGRPSTRPPAQGDAPGAPPADRRD